MAVGGARLAAACVHITAAFPVEVRCSALEQTSTSRYVPPYAIALGYLGFHRADEVFQWLDRAYDARDVHLVFAPVDPKWDPYRGERRFRAYARSAAQNCVETV